MSNRRMQFYEERELESFEDEEGESVSDEDDESSGVTLSDLEGLERTEHLTRRKNHNHLLPLPPSPEKNANPNKEKKRDWIKRKLSVLVRKSSLGTDKDGISEQKTEWENEERKNSRSKSRHVVRDEKKHRKTRRAIRKSRRQQPSSFSEESSDELDHLRGDRRSFGITPELRPSSHRHRDANRFDQYSDQSRSGYHRHYEIEGKGQKTRQKLRNGFDKTTDLINQYRRGAFGFDDDEEEEEEIDDINSDSIDQQKAESTSELEEEEQSHETSEEEQGTDGELYSSEECEDSSRLSSVKSRGSTSEEMREAIRFEKNSQRLRDDRYGRVLSGEDLSQDEEDSKDVTSSDDSLPVSTNERKKKIFGRTARESSKYKMGDSSSSRRQQRQSHTSKKFRFNSSEGSDDSKQRISMKGKRSQQVDHVIQIARRKVEKSIFGNKSRENVRRQKVQPEGESLHRSKNSKKGILKKTDQNHTGKMVPSFGPNEEQHHGHQEQSDFSTKLAQRFAKARPRWVMLGNRSKKKNEGQDVSMVARVDAEQRHPRLSAILQEDDKLYVSRQALSGSPSRTTHADNPIAVPKNESIEETGQAFSASSTVLTREVPSSVSGKSFEESYHVIDGADFNTNKRPSISIETQTSPIHYASPSNPICEKDKSTSTPAQMKGDQDSDKFASSLASNEAVASSIPDLKSKIFSMQSLSGGVVPEISSLTPTSFQYERRSVLSDFQEECRFLAQISSDSKSSGDGVRVAQAKKHQVGKEFVSSIPMTVGKNDVLPNYITNQADFFHSSDTIPKEDNHLQTNTMEMRELVARSRLEMLDRVNLKTMMSTPIANIKNPVSTEMELSSIESDFLEGLKNDSRHIQPHESSTRSEIVPISLIKQDVKTPLQSNAINLALNPIDGIVEENEWENVNSMNLNPFPEINANRSVDVPASSSQSTSNDVTSSNNGEQEHATSSKNSNRTEQQNSSDPWKVLASGPAAHAFAEYLAEKAKYDSLVDRNPFTVSERHRQSGGG